MPSRRLHYSARFADEHDNARLRRPHRKSRGGCLECKQRHLKCDEARPTCFRCSKASRSCTYKDATPSSTPPLATGDGSRHPTPTRAVEGEASDYVSDHLPSVADALDDFMLHPDSDDATLLVAGWPLTREQTALLRHTEEYSLPFGSPDPALQPIVHEVIQTAWTAPYLMDLVLALTSLHLAEMNPSRAEPYRKQAMQLQTRGLMMFNEARQDVLPETCLPMFLFSSVVGTTVLYDVLRSHRDSFTDFLERFVSYLRLHSGVGVITNRSWAILKTSKITSMHKHLPSREDLAILVEQGTECDPLDEMLDQSDLNESATESCRKAVYNLRAAFAIYHHVSITSPHRSSAPMSFASRVNPVFIDLAEQRQPEALIIMAYYAVLIHWCRDFWIFGDAGEFMIRGIINHLGKYWQLWLDFPNTSLENKSVGDA